MYLIQLKIELYKGSLFSKFVMQCTCMVSIFLFMTGSASLIQNLSEMLLPHVYLLVSCKTTSYTLQLNKLRSLHFETDTESDLHLQFDGYTCMISLHFPGKLKILLENRYFRTTLSIIKRFLMLCRTFRYFSASTEKSFVEKCISITLRALSTGKKLWT